MRIMMKNNVKNWMHLLAAFAAAIILMGGMSMPVSAASGTDVTGTSATQSVSEVPANGVSFPTSVTLKVGESKTLTATLKPSNSTYLMNIQWARQANGCFSSASNGCGTYWNQPSSQVITGVKAGTGYLTTTVKVYDSHKNYITTYTVSTTVTVTNGSSTQPTQPTTPTSNGVALKSISLNKSSMTITAGKMADLTVSYNPSNTTVNKSVKWSSSNKAVAEIYYGTVIANKAGTATITATCNGKSATCKVTVKSYEKYNDVSSAYTALNKFRTTKSNQWYWKSNNKSKQKVTGLKKLKRDASLEKIAKQRAKEQWIMYYERGTATHTRPNGKAWKTAYPKSMKYKGENLLWGNLSGQSAINLWAETNEKYKGQGHRRNMLDKKMTKVGIACYEKDGKVCWAMCLCK